MFALSGMAFVSFSLRRLRAILVSIATTVWDIAGDLPGDSRFVNTDYFSDFGKRVACLEQSFNLVTIVKVKLFVFLHDNTNISRLAENPEGLALQGLLSCCTYYLNSDRIKKPLQELNPEEVWITINLKIYKSLIPAPPG